MSGVLDAVTGETWVIESEAGVSPMVILSVSLVSGASALPFGASSPTTAARDGVSSGGKVTGDVPMSERRTRRFG